MGLSDKPRFLGNNAMRINQATMCAMVQLWLDRMLMLGEVPRVAAVDFIVDDDTFEVKLEQRGPVS